VKKFVILFLLISSCLFGREYTSSEASQHIGEEGTVCGNVVSGFYAKNSKGKPTFLNIDKSYPNQIFTVVIWGDSRSNFNYPEEQYKNKNICVSGYIDSYRNIPQISVSSVSQIRNK